MNDPEATLRSAQEQHIHFPINYISTTKYTFYNFFFKNLWEQFHRIANIYFVCLGIITLTPASPVSAGPYIAVIILVLAIVMFKDCWEDWQRYKSDREVNHRTTHILRNHAWTPISWDELAVGDIVRVSKDEEFPADLLLLSTDKENGQCHVQTANLDGEINLKIKEALPFTAHAADIPAIESLKLSFDCGQPSANLRDFDCTTHIDGNPIGYSMDQLLVRSTILKNSEYIHGLAIYTGHQTKYMQNCIDPPHKMSNMEHKLNRYILYILLGLIALCAISAGVGVWYQEDLFVRSWYVSDHLKSDLFVWWILLFFSYLVVYGDVIPISLYVTMEMVRLMQGRFIEVDIHMYHPPTGARMKCLTTTLNEELGQIEYLFSDKTGTLTANKMTLRAVYSNHLTFGTTTLSHTAPSSSSSSSSSTGAEASEHKLPQFTDDNLSNALRSNDQESSSTGVTRLVDFFVALAICNTVFPAHQPDGAGDIIYEAESPDESALVKGAAAIGITLRNKVSGSVTVNIMGDDVTFQLLHVMPFDAERKRMSAIYRYPDGSIRLLIKGADSAMLPLCHPDGDESQDSVQERVDNFATNGLRVLVIGQRILGEEAYQEWVEASWQPMLDGFGKEKKALLKAAITEMERDISLLGATGIEDQLQLGVPDTISALLMAGIKVWVLTGDKMETAINIAQTCNLMTSTDRQCILSGHGQPTPEAMIQSLIQTLTEMRESVLENDNVAMVINGDDIDLVLDESVQELFVEVATRCRSVVVSRATPSHKRLLVALVKEHLDPITAAIGDGANDVPMIQEAHIGIGIYGEEGTQAANNADYSIAQFRFLQRLLLVHGRWSYKRMALLILYFFYKNIVISLIPLWYAIDNGFTGDAFYDSLVRRGYNLIFTSVPIIVMCVLDQDIFAPGCLKYPQLYRETQANCSLNAWSFAKWCFWGLYDSLIIYYFTVLAPYGESSVYNQNGYGSSNYLLSTNCFTSLVLVANVRLAFHCRYWTILHWITFILSIGSWYFLAYVVTLSTSISSTLFGVVPQLYESASFWFVTLLITVVCMLPDFLMRAIRRQFFPLLFHRVQEATKRKVEADLRHSRQETPICLEPDDWCCRWCRRKCPRCC